MFRGWSLSINDMRDHCLQLSTQAKSKGGDFFLPQLEEGREILISASSATNCFSFIKPGDYGEKKVRSTVLGRGSQFIYATRFLFTFRPVDFGDKPFTTQFHSCVNSFPDNVVMHFVLRCANRSAAQAKKDTSR